MKYLVIGDAGFLGRAFAGHLLSKGDQVLGVDLKPARNAGWPRKKARVEDEDRLFSIVADYRPDVVVNFAGIFSRTERQQFFAINCFSMIGLIERCVARPSLSKIKFVLIGSAAEYGIPERPGKLSEASPLRPVTEYGIAKVCQTMLAGTLVKNYRARIVIARPFNIIGAGLSTGLFLGHCASEVARIERNSKPPVLPVGNLNSYRDLISLDKATEMIYIISKKGRVGEVYNVCSGQAVKMRQLLDSLLKYSSKKISLKIDPGRYRKIDAQYIVGDNSKYLRLAGAKEFRDERGLKEAIKATLDWSRQNQ